VEQTKENLLSKAEENGHVNERNYVRPILFYSLLSQATKSQLTKNSKRSHEDIENKEFEKVEEKKFKSNNQIVPSQDLSAPIKCLPLRREPDISQENELVDHQVKSNHTNFTK